MLSAQENDLITRIGPGTPCGNLMRRYWQPAALVDELEGERPVKPVRLLGENLVLFKDEQGRYGLLARHCPHRGADLAFGRREDGGLRCAFHGWLFDVTGQCRETPAEPEGSPLCRNIKQRAYPVVARSGVLWTYMGPGEPPAFPSFDCFVAPDPYTFAFKGLWECNWLQALEVGIDPAHASYLHRFFEDEDRTEGYGKQFRDISTDSDMPMTQLMREHARPAIEVEPTDYGLKILTTRDLGNDKTHVRVTNQIFPHAISIPLSQEMMLTQWHAPVDDENCYWYTVFTSFGKPVDKARMRRSAWRSTSCRTTAPRRTAATTTASTRTSRSTRPIRAWARTSTCTTSGRSRAWVASRIARASISAPPTRPSPSTAACCANRSSRSQRGSVRSWPSAQPRQPDCAAP